MNHKMRAWLLVLGVAVLCIASTTGVALYRLRPLAVGELLQAVPAADAVLVYADFAALRRMGLVDLLNRAGTPVEPEYQAFVRRTDFDYRQDLDAALLAFTPSAKYIVVRGRFDWKALHAYVVEEGGKCLNSVCRLQGSAPEKRISFLPLKRNVMALAVSANAIAATELTGEHGVVTFQAPQAPLWLAAPAAALRSGEQFPEATREFARSVANANLLLLSVGAANAGVALTMDLHCRSDRDAASIKTQLEQMTTRLNRAMEGEGRKPNPADLTGVMAGGTFRADGQHVIGVWPVARVFLEGLLASSGN